jgi:hypothetical protein
MANGGPATIQEFLEAFEEVNIEVRFSAPGQGRMDEVRTFGMSNSPPETFACPKDGCDGAGISLLQPLASAYYRGLEGLHADPSASLLIRSLDMCVCRGAEYLNGQRHQSCSKLFKVTITGQFREGAATG